MVKNLTTKEIEKDKYYLEILKKELKCSLCLNIFDNPMI